MRPELISGGNAPNSSTYPPQSAEPAGDFGWHMGISGGGNHGSVNDPTGRSLPPRGPASGPSARDSAGRAGRRMLTKMLRPERWSATTLLGRLFRNDMHLLPRPIPLSATERQLHVSELPPGTEISSLWGERRHAKAAVYQWPTTVHSRSAAVHLGQRFVHLPFACHPAGPRRRGVSPRRESAPSRGKKRRRRESLARLRAGHRAPEESNSRTRRWEKGQDRRRSTARGPRISTDPDEPSRRSSLGARYGTYGPIPRLVGR